MTAHKKQLVIKGGPHHRRRYAYPEPWPASLIIADAELGYHEYRRRTGGQIYDYVRSYRIPASSVAG